MKPKSYSFLCCAITLCSVLSSHAASFSWDGTSTGAGAQGGAGTWDSNTTANWWDGTTNVVWPNSGTDNDAVFGGTASTAVAVSGTVTANDLSIATGYQIGADNTAGKIILNGTTPTITTTGSGGTANVGAIIDGSAGLTFTGPVTLQLRGANTYTGDTRVLSGTLLIGAGNNRLPTGTTLVLGNSATNTSGVFQMNSRSQQVAGLATAGTGTGNRVINGSTTATIFTVSNTTDQTFGGILGGTGANHNNFAFTKSGAATLVLTNTNTYTGATSVTAGTLTLSKSNTLSQYNNVSVTGTATLALRTGDGTTGWSQAQIDTLRGTSGFSLAAGTFLGFDTGTNGDFTYGTSISGSPTHGLSKLGTGTLGISGSNTYTGTTSIKNGSIALIGGDDRLLTTGTVVLGDVSTSGKLVLGDSTTARNQTLAGLTTTGSGGSVVGAAALNSVLTISNASGTNTFAGKLGGLGTNENNLALIKSGAGTLALSGDNSFAGDVTVNAGRLSLTHSNALGTGTKTFTMQGTSRVLDISNNITLGSNITLNVSTNSGDGAGIVSSSGTNEIQGQVNISTGNPALNISSTAGTLTVSGNVTATVTGRTLYLGGASTNANTVSGIIGQSSGANILPLVKQGAGTWVLTNANTHAGTTKVSGGTLVLGNSLALQNSALDTTSSIIGDSVSGLKTTVTTLTLGGLSGNKDFSTVFTTTAGGYSSVTGLSLNPGTNVSNSYSGIIADGATGMILTKTGAGTQILSGNNTYTGATHVNAGRLLINGNSSTAIGAVTVATGATLGGTGTVGGATTISGTHNAGDSATNAGVGSQAFANNLTYANGSTFEWDLNQSSIGTGFDTVSSAGTIEVGTTNTVFKVIFGMTALAEIQNTGNTFWNTLNGTQTWNMNSIFGQTFSSGAFQSVQTSTDVSTYGSFSINGSALTWTAVPEPTSALAGLVIGVGLLRRRRA